MSFKVYVTITSVKGWI